MKRLALMHYSYPPSMGGVELLMQQQAHVLASLGYDIKILTGSGSEQDSKISLIVDERLQSVLQHNPSLQDKIVARGIMDNDFYQLAAAIKDLITSHLEDREVILVHNMTTLIHNLPFLYAFKQYASDNPQKTIIIWVHDQTYIDEERIMRIKEGVNLSNEQKKILLTPIPGATYVAVSNTFRNLLSEVMNIPPHEIRVVPNGVDMKKFFAFEERIWSVIRQEQILDAYPLIFSPVNILQRKNLSYALDVVNAMKEEYPSLKYLITGKPSIHRSIKDSYEVLKKKVKDLDLAQQVIFLNEKAGGVVSSNTVRDLYNLSDAVFYFSKSENFGIPIIESLLLKTPIFVSDLKVFHEIGHEDLVYIDYLSVSPEVAASQISKTIRESKTATIRKRFRREYDLDKIIQQKLLPLLHDHA